MPEEQVGIKFVGDPSDAVNAAKKVQNETNKIGDEGEKVNSTFSSISSEVTQLRGKIGKIVVAVTAFGAAAYAALRPFREHVAEANKLSRALEISSEKAQVLMIAERKSGLAAGSIRSAIEGLARSQAEGFFSKEMRTLGFTLEEIDKLKPDELFDALSQKLRGNRLPIRQMHAAMNVLGKDGAEVALLLSKNFEYFRDVAKESGKIVSEEAFEKLNKETNTLLARMEVLSNEVLKMVSPWESWAEAASAGIGLVNKGLQELGVLSKILKIVSPSLGATGLAISPVTGVLDKLSEDQERIDAAVNEEVKQQAIGADATSNLAVERARGGADWISQMSDRMKKGGQNISSLQRVGLAASGGESEAIRLQRRQLFKADSMDKLLFNQNKILNDKL